MGANNSGSDGSGNGKECGRDRQSDKVSKSVQTTAERQPRVRVCARAVGGVVVGGGLEGEAGGRNSRRRSTCSRAAARHLDVGQS